MKFNYYGTYMLYLREVKRFLKVFHQTLISPVISALIFLSIFYLSIGDKIPDIHGIKFKNFMSYGLIMMSIIQNSFANTSSSLIMSKMIGYITDILIPPFRGIELYIAFILGAISRGLMVGIILSIVLFFIVDFDFHNIFLALYYAISGAVLMGSLGILSGLASNSFDQNSAVTNYVIVPLSFLSGTFYSVDKLPIYMKKFNLINPFFYLIDGFRYSFTNYSDGNILFGVSYISFLNIILAVLIIKLIDSGWKIKS